MGNESTPARREQALWNVRWLAALAFALLMLIDLLTYERGHALMQSYGAVLAAGLAAVFLYRGDHRADRVYRVGLAFVCWYVLTRILNGDHYLKYDYNQYRAVCTAATYTLAFPLAAMLDDADRRRALDRIALVLTAAMSGLCWLGVIAALRGEVITLPFFGSTFGIMEDGRLYILSQHPNFTAATCLCGLFMLFYLVVSHWRPWVLIPAAAAGAGLFIALPLSDSRTGMAAFLLGVVVAGIVAFQRLPLPARWRRIVEAACLIAVVAAIAVAGFGAAVRIGSSGGEVISQRSLLADLGTLTGRTAAYAAVPATLSQRPAALLIGFDELEFMPALNRNTVFDFSHMHNSFLQTLMVTGLPGLAMALWMAWRVVSSAVRVLFARDCGISAAQKLLVALPAALFLQGMLEHYLFVDSYSILNFVFFLFSGYVVQLGARVTWAQAFPALARRRRAE